MTISPYLKIKKRTQPEWLIHIIIVLPFLFATFIEILGLPSAIKYSLDVCWLFLLILIGVNLNKNKVAIEKDSAPTYMWVVCFLLFTLAVYVFNYQSALYYLWGFRNNFRFYVLFFSCILFLRKENIDNYLKLFDVIFWVSSVLCFFQFFVLGKSGDYLGGIFGVQKGCNGYLNVFLVIISIKVVLYYLNKKEHLWLCISKCLLLLVIAAFAELKFFFVEFLVILIAGVILSEKSYRKVSIFIAGVSLVLLGAFLLEMFFPNFSNFLSLEFFIKSSSTGGYTDSNTLNRLTTIPIISEQILTELPQKLFGLGLGNCDTATFDFLRTPFYDNYKYLRYEWFSSAFILLETGFIGLVMFFGFYVLVGIKSFFMSKANPENEIYCHMALISAIMCVLIGFYHPSLRAEAGYMIYFMLALPFIAKKDTIMK